MPRGNRIRGGKTTVAVSRPQFVLGSRPPSLFNPRMGAKPSADISAKPPRIEPMTGQRNYGKKPGAVSGIGFGNTGLTGES